jgi:hypothetical protein
MPLYDQEKMVKLVSELRKSVARLRSISQRPCAEFLKDPDKIGSSKYHFIVAIESCIDICNHVIARNGYRVRPLNFSLFQNSHVINTVGYKGCVSENSNYSKVSWNQQRPGIIQTARVPLAQIPDSFRSNDIHPVKSQSFCFAN